MWCISESNRVGFICEELIGENCHRKTGGWKMRGNDDVNHFRGRHSYKRQKFCDESFTLRPET